MLQSIRDRAQGVLAWVILILICIPFVFWGIQNYIGGGQEQAVAVVGDKEIFQADLARAYQQIAASLGNIGQIDEETLKKLALKNLIDEEVLRQTAQDRGFAVGDVQVRDTIRVLPYFQGSNGFDKEKYDSILRAQNFTEPYFVEKTRNQMEISQLQAGITRTAFATGPEIDRFLNLRDQLRTAEYVKIPLVESEVEPSPEEIGTYYRQNEAAFRYPEKIAVRYVELSLDDLASKVGFNDEDLQTFYESHQDLYTRKERRKISHILAALDSKAGDKSQSAALEKIKQAQSMLANGEDFASVAEKLSDDKVSGKQGGNIGLINPEDNLDPEFKNAAFSLSLGEVSEPVKTAFGYHLIKPTELEAGEVKPFESVKSEVEKAYRRHQAENSFYELGERLAQISYERPDSLAPAAESAGVEIKTSELFSRDEKQGFGANPKIAQAAFSEQVLDGKNSDPIELSTDRVVFLRVDKHVPAATKPLDEVRGQIVSQIKARNAKEKARKQAEALFAELKSGKSLDQVAESEGLEVEKPEPVARNDAKLPRDLIQALFKTDKPVDGRPVPFEVGLSDGNQVVGLLLGVQNKPDNGPDIPAKETDMAEQWLSTQHANTEFSDMLAQLRQDASVILSEKEK